MSASSVVAVTGRSSRLWVPDLRDGATAAGVWAGPKHDPRLRRAVSLERCTRRGADKSPRFCVSSTYDQMCCPPKYDSDLLHPSIGLISSGISQSAWLCYLLDARLIWRRRASCPFCRNWFPWLYHRRTPGRVRGSKRRRRVLGKLVRGVRSGPSRRGKGRTGSEEETGNPWDRGGAPGIGAVTVRPGVDDRCLDGAVLGARHQIAANGYPGC